MFKQSSGCGKEKQKIYLTATIAGVRLCVRKVRVWMWEAVRDGVQRGGGWGVV